MNRELWELAGAVREAVNRHVYGGTAPKGDSTALSEVGESEILGVMGGARFTLGANGRRGGAVEVLLVPVPTDSQWHVSVDGTKRALGQNTAADHVAQELVISLVRAFGGPFVIKVAGDVAAQLKETGADRILPTFEQVSGQELEEAVHVALGAASVCWQPMGGGVFMSDRAAQIGQELVGVIRQYAQAYPHRGESGPVPDGPGR